MVAFDAKPNIRTALIKQYFQGSQGSLRVYLIKGTAGVFGLHIIATGLGFVTNVLLARILGVTEYGVYTYVFAWVGLLTVIAMFGFGRLLVREIAAYLTQSSFGLIRGLLRFVGFGALIISIAVAVFTGLATWLLKDFLNPQMFPAFWIAMAILPFLTLANLNDNALQGFKRVILGRMPQILIRAPLFIVLVVVAYWLNPQNFTAVYAVGLSLAAIIVTFIAGTYFLIRTVSEQVPAEAPLFRQRAWLNSALPLLMVAVLFEINNRAPVIILGTINGPEEAGIFGVATLIASLISFILLSANAALGPVISSLYTENDINRLQKIITRSARLTFLVAIGMAVLLILSRHWLLLLFGQEFQEAGNVLIILTIGQLVSVAAGSVGLLLVMTGHERNTLFAIAISSAVTVVLNLLLSPFWGIAGAAVATTTSMVIWNLILIFQVRRKLNIDPTVFGFFQIQNPS